MLLSPLSYSSLFFVLSYKFVCSIDLFLQCFPVVLKVFFLLLTYFCLYYILYGIVSYGKLLISMDISNTLFVFYFSSFFLLSLCLFCTYLFHEIQE